MSESKIQGILTISSLANKMRRDWQDAVRELVLCCSSVNMGRPERDEEVAEQYRFVMADVEVKIRYQFAGEYGMVFFGFLDMDPLGQPMYIETTRLYLNDQGFFGESPDEGLCHVNDGSAELFLDKIAETVNIALAMRRGEIEEVD